MWRYIQEFFRYPITDWQQYLPVYLTLSPFRLFIAAVLFILLCLVVIKKFRWSKVPAVLIVFYFEIILMFTILGRIPFTVTSNWKWLFKTYIEFFLYNPVNTVRNIVFNIVLFIPYGFLLQRNLCWKKSAITTALTSLCIEIIQLAFGLGVFEICDLIHNCAGGIFGIAFAKIGSNIQNKKNTTQ